MTTPTENTLALVPPRRPTEDDFGGAAKENDAQFPPNALTMPTAEEWNEKVRMLAAAWRVTPVAVVPVTFIAGAPTVGTPQCGNPALTSATFTPTDVGPGETTIAWPAGTFPSATVPPKAFIDAVAGIWFAPIVVPGVDSVTIKTYDSTSTPGDADFTLFIF